MFVFLYWICWVVVVNTCACDYGVVCVAVFSVVVLLALEMFYVDNLDFSIKVATPYAQEFADFIEFSL